MLQPITPRPLGNVGRRPEETAETDLLALLTRQQPARDLRTERAGIVAQFQNAEPVMDERRRNLARALGIGSLVAGGIGALTGSDALLSAGVGGVQGASREIGSMDAAYNAQTQAWRQGLQEMLEERDRRLYEEEQSAAEYAREVELIKQRAREGRLTAQEKAELERALIDYENENPSPYDEARIGTEAAQQAYYRSGVGLREAQADRYRRSAPIGASGGGGRSSGDTPSDYAGSTAQELAAGLEGYQRKVEDGTASAADLRNMNALKAALEAKLAERGTAFRPTYEPAGQAAAAARPTSAAAYSSPSDVGRALQTGKITRAEANAILDEMGID